MKDRVLCRLEDIPDGGALGIEAGAGGNPVGLVLVRQGEEIHAYENVCPHFSVRLDYQPGVFSTYRGQVLMCAHHSALFRFEDGHCIEGPCQGSRLQPVPIRVERGEVIHGRIGTEGA